ncbi:MAG: hypothetical protein P8X55_15555, partial [Desulfosarcinaceae bacterium]
VDDYHDWYAASLLAHPMAANLKRLLRDLYTTFGLKTRLLSPLIGRYLLIMLRREEKRLNSGWHCEPDTFYEKNPAALALDTPASSSAKAETAASSWATCRTQPTGR